MKRTARHAAILAGVLALTPLAAPAAYAKQTPQGKEPLVIAHRGASAYRPEHTLSAYGSRSAWAPITSSPTWSPRRTASSSPATRTRSRARPTSPSTPSSPGRRTTKVIDGAPITGWFKDFPLAELKTLRAKERLP